MLQCNAFFLAMLSVFSRNPGEFGYEGRTFAKPRQFTRIALFRFVIPWYIAARNSRHFLERAMASACGGWNN
jgi:hypothetical protein